MRFERGTDDKNVYVVARREARVREADEKVEYDSLRGNRQTDTSSHGQQTAVEKRGRKCLQTNEKNADVGVPNFGMLTENMVCGFLLCRVVKGPNGVPDFEVEMANPAFYNGLPRSYESLKGRRLSELIGGARFAAVAAYLRAFRKRKTIRFLQRYESLDRWYEVSAFRVSRTTLAVTLIDRTDEQMAVDFFRIVEEAFIDVGLALTKERNKLEAVVKELSNTDRSKNEFLAVLSHELRNPLAPICNSLYILERSPPGSVQNKRAQQTINRQVKQLTRLVDDLLDLTRIANDKIKLSLSRIELNHLVRRVVEDQRTLFDANGVQLGIITQVDDIFVDGDAERLSQTVGNLLRNAAKFTPRGGKVLVNVALDEATKKAQIVVADTGIGMTPETIAALFQPFKQASGVSEKVNEGLGLGLALVERLTKLHGGTVAARSDGPGKGSVFTVSLPLSHRPAAVVEERGGFLGGLNEF